MGYKKVTRHKNDKSEQEHGNKQSYKMKRAREIEEESGKIYERSKRHVTAAGHMLEGLKRAKQTDSERKGKEYSNPGRIDKRNEKTIEE